MARWPTSESVQSLPRHRRATAPRHFPDGFVWGAATSSFQIEGGRAGRGESIWDRFCAIPGAIIDGSNGDVACGHHEHAAGDVQLMTRTSASAPTASRSRGRGSSPTGTASVAPAGLDFYDRLVDQLLAAGIDPYVTLYHWDLPQALEDDGGWPERATAYHFAEYADVVAAALGDRVKHWATLNEPYCSSHFGYVTGFMAPGRTSVADGFAAAHHLLLGHGLAVERLRDRVPDAEVGIVFNFNPMHPASDDPADVAAAGRQGRPAQPLVRRADRRARLPDRRHRRRSVVRRRDPRRRPRRDRRADRRARRQLLQPIARRCRRRTDRAAGPGDRDGLGDLPRGSRRDACAGSTSVAGSRAT